MCQVRSQLYQDLWPNSTNFLIPVFLYYLSSKHKIMIYKTSLIRVSLSKDLNIIMFLDIWGFFGGSVVKNLLPMQEMWVSMRVRKIPWRRKWQPTPVFLSGKSHGQSSLVGYSSWDCKKESDTI